MSPLIELSDEEVLALHDLLDEILVTQGVSRWDLLVNLLDHLGAIRIKQEQRLQQRRLSPLNQGVPHA